MCAHCVRGFRDHLRARYSGAELRKQFGIEDLEKHQFAEINGWYKPNEMTPLRLEGQRFSDISRKQAFDEIFVKYGRSLKPDLILAQWLHSYQPMPRNDERMMLPADLWAKDEDYLWYCVGKNEATLQLRYMRGAGGDRPFTICHYENVKIRAAMAELAANGGAPMTRYANFNDPESRAELLRFFRFMKKHQDAFRASTMAGEAVLVFPRSQLHQGRFTDAMSAFYSAGERLLNDHVLFDVIPDDIAGPEMLTRYKRVFTISSLAELERESYPGLSRFEAPGSVRVSASRPQTGGVWDIHFVNYGRKEPAGKGSGLIADENPVPVAGVRAELVSPRGFSIQKIEWATPEAPDARGVDFERDGDRARFTAPEFLVYAVARVHLAEGSPGAARSTGSVQRAPRRAVQGKSGAQASSARFVEESCEPTSCEHAHWQPERAPSRHIAP
jgi:hypothetical protein